MSNQHLSRPSALPTWPASTPLSPSGIVTYAHPSGGGHVLYALPTSRLIGAQAITTTNGTAQVAGITLAVDSTSSGTWTVTVNHPLLAAAVTVIVPVASAATPTVQATAIKDALVVAFAAKAQIGTVVTASSSAGTFSVTAVAAAANDAINFTVTAVKTGVASTTTTNALVAGVLGTPADFLGQLAITGATVKVCTNQLLNTWTAVN